MASRSMMAMAVCGMMAAAWADDAYCWIQRAPCRIALFAGWPVDPRPDHDPGASRVIAVGPGRAHESIQTVPWERLKPGDVVEIHARPEPYRDKWYAPASGAPGAPITIRGVRVNGKRPVFDAANAVTRKYVWPTGVEADFNNEDRGILRIGDMEKDRKVNWLVVEGLEFRGARARVPYIASNGRPWAYEYNAAGIYVEHAGNLTIRDCEVSENGMGIFVASPVRPDATGEFSASHDIRIERNYVHGNSYPGGGDQHHNLYLEAMNVRVEGNHFGPPAGPEGSNLKDRSAEAIIRNNWIEGGNRQLDLVESIHPLIAGRGGVAIVEGNVLIDHAGWDNAQIVNFGRDGRGAPRSYLRMAWNMLVSPRPDAVGLRVSDPAELHVAGNALHANLLPAAGGRWFWLPGGMDEPGDNALRPFGAPLTAGHPVVNRADWMREAEPGSLDRVIALAELK